MRITNYESGVTNFSLLSEAKTPRRWRRHQTFDSCEVKKTISLCFLVALLLCCLIAWSPASHAQEATPPTRPPSPKQNQLDKIRKLKERVATKVAELKKKGRRAYFGEIKEIAESTIFLTTKKGEVAVKIGEETKIFRVGLGRREKINLKDLKEEESIVALGISEEEKFPAKIIIAKTLPIIIHGRAAEVDIEGGTVTVKTPKRGEFIVDYEKTTKCRIFEKGEGLVKCGLSKISVDDRVHVVGTEGEEENRITALRILVLPGKALGIVGKEEVTPTATTVPSPTETE